MVEKANIELELAQERTRLARERTILAHIRTDFASFLFGAAILGLFGNSLSFVGAGFILVGIAFLATSGISYLRSNQRVSHLLDGIERPFHRNR